jgi:hypothetical protein
MFKYAIEKLLMGETVTCKPKGNSILPRIKSGQQVIITPVSIKDIELGDVVLCKVSGRVYLHKVFAKSKTRVQIGNNKGRINGWTKTVYGKAKV